MRTDEKRTESRLLCADLVRLDWFVDEDKLRSEHGILEDISRLGACLQLEEPVAAGSVMMLTVGGTPFYGHVRYCHARDDGFLIGLRFSNDTVWSAAIVKPRHLTDPDSLVERIGQ